MSGAPERSGGPVRPVTALVFTTAGFFALLIFGLGMTSLLTGEDVIATPGLGQLPGIAAVILATAAFVAGLWVAVRPPARRHRADDRTTPIGAGSGPSSPEGAGAAPSWHPSYGGAAWTTAAVFLAYLAGVWFGVVMGGSGLALASSVAGRVATSWFGVVIAAAAFVAAWCGIALVRTHARRPRWPWEDEFDE
jgi:hypothetical protein